MIDREKVIKAPEESIDFYKDRIYGDKCNVWLKASYDAIELLKAQEPIAPEKVNRYMETDENGDWFFTETYDCGNCGVELHGKADYCHLCGRPVKWE